MIEAEWWEYDSAAEMGTAIAPDVGFVIEQAIARRGAALISVPGGRTPREGLAALAKLKLDWEKVTVVPNDERLVEEDDPRSNAAMIADALDRTAATLARLATPAELALDYKAAGRSADARLADLPWPLDLAWLGMGTDGHIASIFPGQDLAIALDAPRERHFVGVMPDPLPPEAPVARITLTRPAILSARSLMLTISGHEKRSLLEREIRMGATAATPIGRVLAEAEQPIDIHWCP